MEQQVLYLILLASGIFVGFGAAWLSLSFRIAAARREAIADAQAELARLAERVSRLQGLEAEFGELKVKHGKSLDEEQQLKVRIVELTTALANERSQNPEKLALLEDAKGQLSAQFELLANTILEDKTKRFTDQNQKNLDQLLGPLKTQLQEFQRKVDDVYVQEGKDRTALHTQVRQLMELNQQLSQDAHSLTQALKGSSKIQGNWGEVILQRLLEASGLREGYEYELRETYPREDGHRAQPDVVIHLPEDKHLVVDAKVSLTAYAEYSSVDDDLAREGAAGRHLDSVRRHIKELSEKKYESLYSLKSLDFVVMFVPVEPAFMLAIAKDSELCERAWKRNILVVSPSTFLFTIRTVAYLWRQEQQGQNAQAIARRGAEFYDKLVGFMEDLTGIGERLKQATDSYDNACNKLSKGRGNVIRQAQMLKELGVKPSKELPAGLVAEALYEPLAFPDPPEVYNFGERVQLEGLKSNSEEDAPF